MSSNRFFTQEEAILLLQDDFPESSKVGHWINHPPGSQIRQVAKLRSGTLLEGTWAEAHAILLPRLLARESSQRLTEAIKPKLEGAKTRDRPGGWL